MRVLRAPYVGVFLGCGLAALGDGHALEVVKEEYREQLAARGEQGAAP